MSPEQLKALGVKPRAWLVSKEHSGKVFFYIEEVSDWIEDNPDWAVTEELYPHSDLMKVCAAYEARIAELEKDARRYRAHRSSVMREYECSKGFWWRVIGTDTTKFDAAYDLDFPELKDAAIEAETGRTK